MFVSFLFKFIVMAIIIFCAKAVRCEHVFCIAGLLALDCLVTTRKKQLTPLYYVAIDKVMAAHVRWSGVSFSFLVTVMNCPDSQAMECS